MKIARLLVCLGVFILTTGAREPTLVPDVSQRQVEIAYSFTGAELLLFGAIVYPDGEVPSGRADIAVVLKGPSTSIQVREKQKLFGLIWYNAAGEQFRSVPDYYAIATSRPLKQLVDDRTAAIYELGLSNIQLSPSGNSKISIQRRFENGLVALRTNSQLYTSRYSSVEITKNVLYRARIAIPARVSVGQYTAETFLISNGKVIAAATRTIDIRKSGFEQFVATSADRSPVLYGLTAIMLALALGWGAGEIFRKI